MKIKELYRIYEETLYGYELNSTITDINDLYAYLDYVVYHLQPKTKVLVVRHNIEHNYDEVMYLYKGIMINSDVDYEMFKDRENKRLRKTLD